MCNYYMHTQELHEYLKTVCGDLHVTKGDFDEDSSYPEQKVGNSYWCSWCMSLQQAHDADADTDYR